MSARPGGRIRITVGQIGRRTRSRLPHWRTAFRTWRLSRPFWGGLWCVLGGALIAYFPSRAFRFLLVTNGDVVLGVSVGVAVVLMGLVLWFAPSQRHLAGLLAILFSVVSLITSTFGGLVIGLVLGTIGGAMGFAWSPRRRDSPS